MIFIKKNIEYKCARWKLPDGTYFSEKMPQEYENNHFGPELRQHIIYQHHFNRVPQGKIYLELRDKGIDISTGQINSILAEAAKKFTPEKENMLASALPISDFVQVDDTGGRHQGKNQFSTVICNDFFVYFKTTKSKSRINFLQILNANNEPYAVDENAIMYAKKYCVSKSTMEWFESKIGSIYYEPDLENFFGDIILSKKDKRIITEACLFAACINGGMPIDLKILSDDAKQFDIANNALCWIHAERAIKKIVPIDDEEKAAIVIAKNSIWNFYRELKEYREFPSEEKKEYLSKKFDEIFSTPTYGYSIAPIFATFLKNKKKLLLILDYPNLPLHNNTSEQDIREYVIKRKISGGTRSDLGREARDTFTSIIKTCLKNKVSFWDFVNDRIKNLNIIPSLSEIVVRRMLGQSP